jgi:hypothetical protein
MAKALKNIHPLIQELNLSNKTKAYFNKLEFYEIIEDDIILSDEFNDLDEALKNRWSFGVDLRYCTADDLKVFYEAIINSRRKFLKEKNIAQQMIFYTWYDGMSGNFYFSIIPQDWNKLPPGKELPFGGIINKVESVDDIIEEFVNDKYKGVIPMDEFETVDSFEELDYEDYTSNFTLNVWSTTL